MIMNHNYSEVFNIACCCDDNYAQACGVMLCSLLSNNAQYSFHIHLLVPHNLEDNNLQYFKSLFEQFRCGWSTYVVDETPLEGVKFREKQPLTKAAYYRLLFASILPKDINKVLYLDCDIIVINDIGPLFKIELSRYALAAVRDTKHIPYSDTHRIQLDFSTSDIYFNSGIMVINLEFWRSNHAEEKLIEYAKRERIVFFHDQDALNYVFKGMWYSLSPKWNRFNMVEMSQLYITTKQDKKEFLSDTRIIHYATPPDLKPWTTIKLIPKKKYYLKYKSKSPWAMEQSLRPNSLFREYFRIVCYYIEDFFSRSPSIIYVPYLLAKDFLYFLYCIFLKKQYCRDN